jgi:hypothetical protein
MYPPAPEPGFSDRIGVAQEAASGPPSQTAVVE